MAGRAAARGDLNDMSVAADGTAYVGDMGARIQAGGEMVPGQTFRVAPDGSRAERAFVDPDPPAAAPDGDGRRPSDRWVLPLAALGAVAVLLANLEDGVPATDKEAARAGLVNVGKTVDFGRTQFWTRVNSLDSPWGLDDLTTAVTEVGEQLAVEIVERTEQELTLVLE